MQWIALPVPFVSSHTLRTTRAFPALPRTVDTLAILLTGSALSTTLLSQFQFSIVLQWIALPVPFVSSHTLRTTRAFPALPRTVNTLAILLAGSTLAAALLSPFQFSACDIHIIITSGMKILSLIAEPSDETPNVLVDLIQSVVLHFSIISQ